MNLPTMLNYTLFGGTPLSLFGGVEALAFVKSKLALANDWPDIELHFGPGTDLSDDGKATRIAHGVPDDIWNSYYVPILGRDSWTILPAAMQPKSRGYIRLNSADPYDKPLINPNYYQDPHDLQVTIEAVKIALALSKTEAFQQFGTKFYDKPFPGCESYTMFTDAYWGCWIKSYSVSLVHTVGTCKMGPDSDPTAVVDPTLKLRGIKNLRVADIAIMPFVPSGNTMAPTVNISFCKISIILQNNFLLV